MEREPIQFQVVCTDLPAQTGSVGALRLGLQVGSAVVQDVETDVESATFRADVEVGRNRRTGMPQFFGPIVQGPTDAQFIYLSWGLRDGETWTIVRRAKLPLAGIGWDLIQQATIGHAPLSLQLNMTDPKGQPLAASIKPHLIQWYCG